MNESVWPVLKRGILRIHTRTDGRTVRIKGEPKYSRYNRTTQRNATKNSLSSSRLSPAEIATASHKPIMPMITAWSPEDDDDDTPTFGACPSYATTTTANQISYNCVLI